MEIGGITFFWDRYSVYSVIEKSRNYSKRMRLKLAAMPPVPSASHAAGYLKHLSFFKIIAFVIISIFAVILTLGVVDVIPKLLDEEIVYEVLLAEEIAKTFGEEELNVVGDKRRKQPSK